jgi:hypothetical protein
MKYAVEMGSGAVIYMPSFIKIGSAIQKFIRGNTWTHSTVISEIPVFNSTLTWLITQADFSSHHLLVFNYT